MPGNLRQAILGLEHAWRLGGRFVVPDFDFTDDLALQVDERKRECVSKVKQRLTDQGLPDVFDIPTVPFRGASEEELKDLGLRMGVPL